MSIALWIIGIIFFIFGGLGMFGFWGGEGGQGDMVQSSFASLLLLAAAISGVLWLILLAVKLLL